MAGLIGPIAISANLQLRLPIKVARAMRFEAGDEFYVRVSDDDPDVIVLLPAEVVERRYSAGELLDRGARGIGSELGAIEGEPQS